MLSALIPNRTHNFLLSTILAAFSLSSCQSGDSTKTDEIVEPGSDSTSSKVDQPQTDVPGEEAASEEKVDKSTKKEKLKKEKAKKEKKKKKK